MSMDADRRIDLFWKWFEHNSAALRSAFLRSCDDRDDEAANALAETVYERVADISDEFVVDLHGGQGETLLAIRTGLNDRTLVDRVLARAPSCVGWRFAAEIPRDLESVEVRDGDGRELVVLYSALSFVISGAQPDGTRTVLLVFDGEFDPGGPDKHLFDAVATHVLTTLIGRIPAMIGAYSLVPAREAYGVASRPILELTDAWAEATRDA